MNFIDGLGDSFFIFIQIVTVFYAVLIGTQYNLHLTLSLSFCSTRKESLMGLRCYRTLPIIPVAVLSYIIFMLAGTSNNVLPIRNLIYIVGMFLLFGSVGAFCGMLFAKTGKNSITFLTALFGGILWMGIVTLVSISGFEDLIVFGFDWIMLTVGLLAYALSIIPERKSVYSFNVKL